MKVYILTAGNYPDDYRIVGVFRSKEKADEFASVTRSRLAWLSGNYNEPEEFETDPTPSATGEDL